MAIGLVGNASALTVPIVRVGVCGTIATGAVVLAAATTARARLRGLTPATAGVAG